VGEVLSQHFSLYRINTHKGVCSEFSEHTPSSIERGLVMIETIETLSKSLDMTWILIAAALVFFMQAGFAMVESGLTRAKNAGNIIMKNLMDFALGTVAYWFIGFGIMFGTTSLFFGGFDIFSMSTDDYTTLIFQTVFCATSATIVSGAMAERTKFSSYCIYSIIISLVVYPVSGHWIWGGGFLSEMGFHDFAGSTAVHMVGGVAALVGAIILGPRIGKYAKDGKPRAIQGHSMTLAALGVFILWFGWFGFNGGSTIAMTGGAAYDVARIFFTTNLSAAVSTCVACGLTWIRYKKPDVSMSLNGALAGLVAITAGCDTVTPFGAAVIGLIAGVVIVFGIEFIDKVLKIDDPVGAIGVHGLSGLLGTLLVGIFAYNPFGDTAEKAGLIYGGGFKLLGVQAIGAITVMAWVAVTMTIIFLTIKIIIGLRVKPNEELEGLDIHEHGLVSAYDGFLMAPESIGITSEITGDTPIDEAIPVELKNDRNVISSDVKMTMLSIITKQSKFEVLKEAMIAIGVRGMTVTNVLGCTFKHDKDKYYRGVKVDEDLMPKVQIDIVVSKISPRTVIETAKKALYTGQLGDGKIFIYDVENVVKIRSGEEGYDALQDEE